MIYLNKDFEMRKIYPYKLKKESSLKFFERYPELQTTEEGQMVQWLKHCNNKIKMRKLSNCN